MITIKMAIWSIKTLYKIDKLNSIVYLITSLITGFKGVLNTYILSKIIDKAVSVATSAGNIREVVPLLLYLFIANLILTFIRYAFRISAISINIKTSGFMRRLLYKKLDRLGIQTLEDPAVNNMLHRSNENISMVLNFYTQVIDGFSYATQSIGTFLIAVKLVPAVIPFLLIQMIPRYYIDKKYRKQVWDLEYNNTEGKRKAQACASDLSGASSLQEIFINDAHNFLDSRYTNFWLWWSKVSIDIRKNWFAYNNMLSLIADTTVYAAYYYLFSQVIAKTITIGTALFYVRNVETLQDSMASLINVVNNITESSLRLKDTYDLFQMEEDKNKGTKEMAKLSTGPKIELHNLSFKYPSGDNKAIDDLTLTIKAGEKIAIVGHNGAGKTTLVKLINKQYRPTSGSIIVNDINLDDLLAESWYKNVGVLFQEFSTYPQLSVKENIIIGDPNREDTEYEVIEAAKNADAYDFIMSYPNRFDQVLNEKFKGGIRPSTGQWQKIAIARFFYRNAPLVIFDEPTAAIDAISEYNIFNKIYEFFKGKTVIIISHRFSTVRNADRILVMEQGKIVEDGTHESLLQLDGYYAKSFKLQAEGYSK